MERGRRSVAAACGGCLLRPWAASLAAATERHGGRQGEEARGGPAGARPRGGRRVSQRWAECARPLSALLRVDLGLAGCGYAALFCG